MATIKSYTDLVQSKKLAEFLLLKSADMYYFRQIDNDYFPPNVESICPIPLFKNGKEDFNYDTPCWSLASLLGVLHDYTLQTNTDGKVFVVRESKKPMISDAYDNSVDACVAMIEKLHKLKML